MKFEESGTKVVYNGRNDSKYRVAFFRIGDESGKSSPIRDIFHLEGKLCDLLVYFRDTTKDNYTLMLVEAKGNDIHGAIEQIENTYNNLARRDFKEIKGLEVNWMAYICYNKRSSSPIDTKSSGKKLKQVIGGGACDIKKDGNISSILIQHG
ncbi:MAG: hypothetical protein U9N40_02050 [Euryarchaeota archaeon]|nr:hypothetical protein [Euryarchaeota archaeon]